MASLKGLFDVIKKARYKIRKMFNFNGLEEEIALTLLGIIAIVSIVLGYKDIGLVCIGAIAGYLSKGYKDARKE